MDIDLDLEHPSWRTLVGTGLGYGVMLVALFVVLFVIPYLVFLLV